MIDLRNFPIMCWGINNDIDYRSFQEKTLSGCEQLIERKFEGWRAYHLENTHNDLEFYFVLETPWEDIPFKHRVKIKEALMCIIIHGS